MKKSITIKEMWKEYGYKFLPKHPFYVADKIVFYDILKEYNQLRSKLLIEQGYTSKNKNGLGDFFIAKIKGSKKKYMDYQHWKKTGEVRLLENLHTDGYFARFYWIKGTTNKLSKQLYTFTPTRPNARALAKFIKENGINTYREIFNNET